MLNVVRFAWSLILPPRNALEMEIAIQLGDLRTGTQLDRRTLLDAPDQVARHCLGQSSGSDQHVNLSRRLRQEHRCLTGGVAATDDDYFFALTEL